jgi:AmmeMemoRadiSam system protein A
VLSPDSRTTLLALAKHALESFVLEQPVVFPKLTDVPGDLSQPGTVFVTLRVDHTLRGCIGNLDRAQPLAYAVMKTAIASASEDPRFGPLTRKEFNGLSIEISVLSPLRRIQDDSGIIPGEHGVLIVRGPRKGLFLLQVWKETGWDKTRFLKELCQDKAGLSANAWKDPQTEIYVFDAESFCAAVADIPNPTAKQA